MRPVRVGGADQGELLGHGTSIPRGCDNLGPRALEVPLTTSNITIRPLTGKGLDRLLALEGPSYGRANGDARPIVMA
jgi:hypothetical protein